MSRNQAKGEAALELLISCRLGEDRRLSLMGERGTQARMNEYRRYFIGGGEEGRRASLRMADGTHQALVEMALDDGGGDV